MNKLWLGSTFLRLSLARFCFLETIGSDIRILKGVKKWGKSGENEILENDMCKRSE